MVRRLAEVDLEGRCPACGNDVLVRCELKVKKIMGMKDGVLMKSDSWIEEGWVRKIKENGRAGLYEILKEELLREVITETCGVTEEAARLLGVTAPTVNRWVRKYRMRDYVSRCRGIR